MADFNYNFSYVFIYQIIRIFHLTFWYYHVLSLVLLRFILKFEFICFIDMCFELPLEKPFTMNNKSYLNIR